MIDLKRMFDRLEWEVEGGMFTNRRFKDILTGEVSGTFIGSISYLFQSYEDCIAHHDKTIKDHIEYKKDDLTTGERAAMLRKLIVPDKPDKSELEVAATEWYENLSAEEQRYVKWIKKHYSDA